MGEGKKFMAGSNGQEDFKNQKSLAVSKYKENLQLHLLLIKCLCTKFENEVELYFDEPEKQSFERVVKELENACNKFLEGLVFG